MSQSCVASVDAEGADRGEQSILYIPDIRTASLLYVIAHAFSSVPTVQRIGHMCHKRGGVVCRFWEEGNLLKAFERRRVLHSWDGLSR